MDAAAVDAVRTRPLRRACHPGWATSRRRRGGLREDPLGGGDARGREESVLQTLRRVHASVRIDDEEIADDVPCVVAKLRVEGVVIAREDATQALEAVLEGHAPTDDEID